MLIVLNFFDVFSAGNGGVEFTAASQAMIDSPIIPPEVKKIFQDFIAIISKFKLCVDQANLQCMKNVTVKTALGGMEQGVKLTHGPLQQLFKKMLNFDRLAFEKARELPENAVQEAASIANFVLSTKAKWIQEYLRQFH